MRFMGRTPAELVWIGWPVLYYLALWIKGSPSLAQGLAVGVPFSLVFFAITFAICQRVFEQDASRLEKYALSGAVLAVAYLFVAPIAVFLLVWATP